MEKLDRKKNALDAILDELNWGLKERKRTEHELNIYYVYHIWKYEYTNIYRYYLLGCIFLHPIKFLPALHHSGFYFPEHTKSILETFFKKAVTHFSRKCSSTRKTISSNYDGELEENW